MTRVGLYIRVANDTEEKERTIQNQLEALRAHIQAKGYELVGEFIDEGYSGMSLARPALNQLRDATAKGYLDLLLVQSPDQLSRKSTHYFILLNEFQKEGVTVEFLNRPIDTESQLLLAIQKEIDEYERTEIAERTRCGK